MHKSFLAIAGLLTATYALPTRDGSYGDGNGNFGGRGGGEGRRGGRRHGGRRGKYVPVEPVTTKFQYLCPTGVKEVETVVTELPEENTSIGGIIPGWSEYITSCTYCENPAEPVTLTLPPDVYPTGPESGPITSEYDQPEETAAPEPTGTEEQPAEESGDTGAEEPSGDAGTEPYPSESLPAGETPSASVPEETGTPEGESSAAPSATSPPEGETYTADVPEETASATEESSAAASATTPAEGETYTGSVPEETAPANGESSAAASATTPAEGETYTGSVPEETAPAGGESSAAASATSPSGETNYVIPNLPAVTAGEEAITTRVGCTYTDIGNEGLVTRTVDVETEIPATATGETYTISMTESVAVCTVCGDAPETYTLTVPAYETPSAEEPDTPAESSAAETGEESSPSETSEEDTPTETGEEATPSETSPAGESSAYVPVIPNIPTPTAGEEVVTSKIACTYTSIGESGLTTATAEVTAEIPATATDVEYTISMTETVTLCTVCGDKPTSVTLTVPVETAVESPEEEKPGNGNEETPDNGNEETPDNGNEGGDEGTPDNGEDDSGDSATPTTSTVGYITSVPQIDIPVVSEGEAVYTTVIRTTYVDVCPTGFTTKTVDYTAEVPASVSSTEFSYVMTETTTLCTAGCGAEPTSVVVTVPVYSSTTKAANELPEPTPVDSPVVPIATTITRTRTATRPVYGAPTVSSGEPALTTVITKSYVTICPTGFSTATTILTAEVPETYTDAVEVSMTTTNAVCTACGSNGPETVTLTVPAYEVTTEEAIQTTVYIPETQVQTVTQTITNSAGEQAEETVVSIPGYVPVTQESAPGYIVATETAYAVSPAETNDASYVEYTVTTAYATIGESGVVDTTVTITAVATTPPVIGESVYTTVCNVCGEGEQTLTLTVPEITSTVTFYPSTLLPSASAGANLAENATTSGNNYLVKEPQAQEQEFQITSGAEKNVLGWGVMVLAGVVGMMVL